MTHRLTISIPDDVADRLEQEPNASAFIAEAVRHRMRGEQIAKVIEADGIQVTAQGRARARERLNEARSRLTAPEAVAGRAVQLAEWNRG